MVDLLEEGDLKTLRSAHAEMGGSSRAGFDSTMLNADSSRRRRVHSLIAEAFGRHSETLPTGFRIAFCTFAVKSADSDQSAVPMHQDWSFVDEERFISIGVWCPLIDVDLHNGCLQVVKGSHAFGHMPRAACTPFAYPELEAELREKFLTNLPMRAGQALLFDQRLFHCSPPNRSGCARIAATAVMIPVEAKLRYYHLPDPQQRTRLEVFEVEDGFYLSHIPGRRPEGAAFVGFIDFASRKPEVSGR